ncbi:DUF4476 domain-containing protein [Chitinophaga sp. Cy-1792]|uniref:DUF4476 domain-containing protein n=1 Tax=Chitinophaga sp. Cy-1792 TaxID=2608339 RepID=UPI00141DAD78|nr:DUF4476 domain-containing protein [Chitinophaga sp. Cy-1792]NIG51851.1 DUF4476 domain-containing protein [Chitinophaga sp. Cy-1792]
MQLNYRTVILACLCLLLGTRIVAQSQQNPHYYIYIQSEKGQPFYVKHDGDVLSSTERGYIILPKLSNGAVPITVGFPKNEAPEQHFNIRVSQADQGFLLKKASANAYALYNMQTFRELKSDALQKATADESTQEPEKPVETAAVATTEPDTRKDMMNDLQKDVQSAVGTTAVVTNTAVKTPKPSGNGFASALDKIVVSGDDREDVVAEANKNTAVAKGSGKAAAAAVIKEKAERAPLTDDEKALLADVLAEESRTAASEAAADDVAKGAGSEGNTRKSKHHKKKENDPEFIDFQDDKNAAPAALPPATPAQTSSATITPVEEEAPAPKKKKHKASEDADVAVPVTEAAVPVDVAETHSTGKKKHKKEDTRSGEIVTDTSGYGVAMYDQPAPARKKKKKDEDEAVAATDESAVAANKNVNPRLINSDCANIMDDATFRKMLRRFVAAASDDGMLDVFRKQSRNYCMETTQIKTLAQLVVGEDARYRLLDMAYSKTYDTEKYAGLESVLTDNYYKGRFKAMLHK